MTQEHQAILAVLSDYFDVLYKGDVSKVDNVFSPNSHVYSVANGALVGLAGLEPAPRPL